MMKVQLLDIKTPYSRSMDFPESIWHDHFHTDLRYSFYNARGTEVARALVETVPSLVNILAAGKPWCVIDMFKVAPSFQRQGVGTEAAQYLLNSLGNLTIYLDTETPAAATFWEGLGFVRYSKMHPNPKRQAWIKHPPGGAFTSLAASNQRHQSFVQEHVQKRKILLP